MSPGCTRLALLAAGLTVSTLVVVGCSRHASGVLTPLQMNGTAPTEPTAQANVPPDSWFAGPDPNDPAAGWQTATGLFGGRFMRIADWSAFKGVAKSMLDKDSLHQLPADRPQRKTFFEAYNDRLWLRQEGDTVHLNSWVIFASGGSDPDSPYSVHVDTATLPPGPLRGSAVLRPGKPNGSPIGFHLRVQVKDASGQVTQPSQSLLYPVFDPNSPFQNPVINGYWGLTFAGKAYAVVSAEDGDGGRDQRVQQQPGGAVGIADRVDAGGGSADDRALRSKILTFFVNHPPQLLTANPQFRPRSDQVFTSRTLRNGAELSVPIGVATDDDPLDPSLIGNQVGGTGSNPTTLRLKIAILGKFTSDPTRDTCYVAPDFRIGDPLQVIIPPYIANGNISVVFRLCDCLQCDALIAPAACPAFAGHESFAGQGTCVDTAIPCRLAAP